jgi:hypothetical protein
MEKLTEKALDENFSALLKKGNLIFKAVNIDQTGNQKFVQEYKLFTKSVVLVDFMEKRQLKWKRLDQKYKQEINNVRQYCEKTFFYR